jgi:hypothetical protein
MMDIASRVYIYNTLEFSINDDARFVVDALFARVRCRDVESF